MHSNASLPISVKQDLEWSGALVQSVGDGAKFALLLSMMAPDVLTRPSIHAQQESEAVTAGLKSDYPQQPLSASERHWRQAAVAGKTLQHSVADAQLWHTMHPQPLSVYDDNKRIDDSVIANCDIHTQRRLNTPPDSSITVDETQLYDVLNALQPASA